mgnify:CR=1 FL=1
MIHCRIFVVKIGKMQTDFHGTPIFYDHDVRGTKTLVLLHGFLEDRSIWSNLYDSFSPNLSLLAIDLPGHGESGLREEVLGMTDMAEVVFHVMTVTQTTSAYVMGHSMGGYVALAFAEKFPQACEGLILLNSSCEADSPERIVNRKRALQVIKKNKDSFISMAITNLFSPSARKSFESEIKKLIKKAQAMEVKSIEASIRGMIERKDRTQFLRQWKRPKYLICGAEDPIIPFSASKNMALLTKTPLIRLDGSHMGWLENPSELKKHLRFIE